MNERESLREFARKVVVAHPSRGAEADQFAAATGADRVKLSEFIPTTHVYVIDVEKLMELPERFDFGV